MLSNYERQGEGDGGKEERRKDRKKEGNIMTKLKTEMTMSYPQIGETGWRRQSKPCCTIVQAMHCTFLKAPFTSAYIDLELCSMQPALLQTAGLATEG